MVDKVTELTGLDTVLIKVASRCNINCSYCYVYNMGDDNWARQSKFMTAETEDAVCASLGELVAHQQTAFSVVLHGGEPLLLGEHRLKNFLGKLRNVLPPCYPISLQTNGILITDVLLDTCALHQVSVAVSLDGPAHVHDKFRVTHGGAGTFDQVIAGLTTLQQHPAATFLNAGLLAVIDPDSNPAEIYHFFKSLNAPSVDFLYKDGNHTNLPVGKATVNSLEYGTWMTGLLQTYIADPAPLPIRVLDDMLKVLLGGAVSKEGMGLTDFGILIIDTDGTYMKNDTLKSSYNGADKFPQAVNVKQKTAIDFLQSSAFEEYRALQRPTSAKCLGCPELNVCGGGMILHRWRRKNGFHNESVYCADQLHLIASMRHALSEYNLSHAYC
ncbi:radical SAM protein [Hymenobacter sp. ISL-91]|uniref:cyclophane-forming radical SAM/SPASM peptide maturase YhhB n=1 Tax=Hymenobacter sp. ISL-91 TaxID=2819151 RepID=UPI001BE9C582|nr:cyclophane-forming radical SAM/SPASM peptide maturase YhhB [Hymenobacter sp. ISL-91]MBT2557994.1 radical SAM protein [Hymenobacter sp. ISL-91]